MTKFFENRKVTKVGEHVIEKRILVECANEFVERFEVDKRSNFYKLMGATSCEISDKSVNECKIYLTDGEYQIILSGGEPELIPLRNFLYMITGGTNYRKIRESNNKFILTYV